MWCSSERHRSFSTVLPKKWLLPLWALSPTTQWVFLCLCCHNVMNRLNGNNGANSLSLEKAVTVLYSIVHSGCDRAALWRVETERSREKSKPCPISQSCTQRPSHLASSERRWRLVFPVLFFPLFNDHWRWKQMRELGWGRGCSAKLLGGS